MTFGISLSTPGVGTYLLSSCVPRLTKMIFSTEASWPSKVWKTARKLKSVRVIARPLESVLFQEEIYS